MPEGITPIVVWQCLNKGDRKIKALMSPASSFLQTERRGTQRAGGLPRDSQVERKDEITGCWILSRFRALPGLKPTPVTPGETPCDFCPASPWGNDLSRVSRGSVSGSRPMILRGMHPALSVMRHLWTLIKKEAKSRFHNLVPTLAQAQLSVEREQREREREGEGGEREGRSCDREQRRKNGKRR